MDEINMREISVLYGMVCADIDAYFEKKRKDIIAKNPLLYAEVCHDKHNKNYVPY